MAKVIQPPNEVVCDYSRALLTAIVQVFFKVIDWSRDKSANYTMY